MAEQVLLQRAVPHLMSAAAAARLVSPSFDSRFVIRVDVDPRGTENSGNFYALPRIDCFAVDTTVDTGAVATYTIDLPSTFSRISVEDAAINAVRRHGANHIPSAVRSLRRGLGEYLRSGILMPVDFDPEIDDAESRDIVAVLERHGTFEDGVLRSYDVPEVLARKIEDDLGGSPYTVGLQELTATLQFRYNTQK